VAEAHEEPKCGKGADAWQARLTPWLACATAAGSGRAAAIAAAPGPKLPSARNARAAADAASGDGDSSGGEDSIAGLQGSAGTFAEVCCSLPMTACQQLPRSVADAPARLIRCMRCAKLVGIMAAARHLPNKSTCAQALATCPQFM
jgi:hypothetical protein